MFADITKPPAPLPSIQLAKLRQGASLLYPLSRRGYGPGLIVLHEDSTDPLAFTEGIPSPLVKWAEEGYAVVQLGLSAFEGDSREALKEAVEALKECEKCEPKGSVGLVAYSPDLWNRAVPELADVPEIIAGIVYADKSTLPTLQSTTTAVLQHIAGQDAAARVRSETLVQYYYPGMKSHAFAVPGQDDFHYNTEAVAHTRNLQFLKPRMGGPYFDLETIWNEHTYYEFADRSVEHTMSTMVEEPYVNHVPTITGGIGRENLSHFYTHNFIFNNSADTELELISRTIGIDRVVDEFIFKFTHDRELDWLIPGIPPTNREVEVPFTAVVNIRGDRLYHEHIAWDQGTVLRQLGLMPDFLPFPYALPDGRAPGSNMAYEYRVPVAGADTASKMRNRNGVPSNEMFQFQIREVAKSD
ncbi:uncharacterized protein N7459_009546 [Penicillium hispanicum]|uniref:uncharacterized protein n=1 Tax=Penicillium hispanicum TaxID=1080232 RepID=UPI002541DA03|nr:uncharacterized protein N7459_009546 [Penicillium hispanicum]KAJ5570116.1 hypothetical protein N7459_009546 [Penicillium hispanicum]